MKRILLIVSILVLVFSMSFDLTNADSLFKLTIGGGSSDIPYCQGSDCGLNEGIDAVKDVDAIETERSASQYIQAVVEYIFGFLMLLATLIIIYAGFVLMLGLGDEDKAKKTKQIMIYAIIGLVVIFLAGPLSDFIFNVLNT